jgi:hypothetical protein
MTGPVNTVRNSFHGCTLLAVLLSSYCTRPHPCTVTASHHIHTRPPDIPVRLAYQRPLVNTYCTSDLCRQIASDDVQNENKRYGRVAGIPPRPRSSSSDILHTSGPPNIGPRGDCVSRQTSPTNLTMQHWHKEYHKILDYLDVDQDLFCDHTNCLCSTIQASPRPRGGQSPRHPAQ